MTNPLVWEPLPHVRYYPDAQIEPGTQDARSSWAEFESLAVQMSREVPLRALEAALTDAQERLIDSCVGRGGLPAAGTDGAVFGPALWGDEDFARKGKRSRKLDRGGGVVELVLWHVGCR